MAAPTASEAMTVIFVCCFLNSYPCVACDAVALCMLPLCASCRIQIPAVGTHNTVARPETYPNRYTRAGISIHANYR